MHFFLGALRVIHFQASGCSAHTDCPIDECCGQPRYDVLNLVKSCIPYAKEFESCHGSLLSATCECEAGLVCQEHSGIFSLLHPSKGECLRADGSSASTSIFG